MPELPNDAVRGPVVRPANRSRHAEGSIHDDATAAAAGFRGGTVAGSIHLDHFPPLLVDAFGPTWFERGFLSMYFREPTTHLDPVQAAHGPGDDFADAWIVAPDGGLVAEGAAGLSPYPPPTPLRRRDRRPVDIADLDLLADAPLGERLTTAGCRVNLQHQHRLLDDPALLSQPLDWYRDESPWGPPVACPSIMVDTMWSPFVEVLRPVVKPAVGLYGAIEVQHRGSPLLAETDYELDGVITEVSRSPRTEIFWAETTASLDGAPVASLVMMIRLLL